MRLVAPLSALYRGSDHGWLEVRRLAQRAEIDNAAERARHAVDAQDLRTQVEALQAQVAALASTNDDLTRLADSYAHEAEAFRAQAEDAAASAGEAKYWRELYASTQMSAEEEVDPWTAIAPLVPAEDPIETFIALNDAAADHIVFTDQAAKSWRDIDYPEPEDMLEKLVLLAKGAVQLYGGDPGSIGHLDDWFRVNHGLKVAMSDETIGKTKSLRYFVFEGKKYDQTPHVKVRDGVKPNQVGRIHFALDSDRKRIVVNHVALKLYGL